MKPYLPIGLLLSLLFVLCSNSSHAVDEAKSPLFGKRPNIVLIMTDDQGWLHLGSSGHPFLHTPRSDEFAKESLVFNDFVVSSTCAPTRAALMSGAHPFKSGVTHTIHDPRARADGTRHDDFARSPPVSRIPDRDFREMASRRRR